PRLHAGRRGRPGRLGPRPGRRRRPGDDAEGPGETAADAPRRTPAVGPARPPPLRERPRGVRATPARSRPKGGGGVGWVESSTPTSPLGAPWWVSKTRPTLRKRPAACPEGEYA